MKYILVLVVVFASIGLFFFALPVEGGGHPVVLDFSVDRTARDLGEGGSDQEPLEPHREELSEEALLLVHTPEGSLVERGSLVLRLRYSGNETFVDCEIYRGVPSLESSVRDALLSNGALVCSVFSDGDSLAAVEPVISAGSTWPLDIETSVMDGLILDVYDAESSSPITGFAIWRTGFPIPPQWPSRMETVFDWKLEAEFSQSPAFIDPELSGDSWVFASGYSPTPVHLKHGGLLPIEVSMVRSGTIELVQSGNLSEYLGESLTFMRKEWSFEEIVEVDWGSPETMVLPAGRYSIGTTTVDRDGSQVRSGMEILVDVRPGVNTLVKLPGKSGELIETGTLFGLLSDAVDLKELQVAQAVSVDRMDADPSGEDYFRVFPLREVGESGNFEWGPIQLVPGEYRIALAGTSFAEDVLIEPGQGTYLTWRFPGVAKVAFHVTDGVSGNPVNLEYITYFQSQSGISPEGVASKLPFKTIGFPIGREVLLPAGVTWFRLGFPNYASVLDVAELLPGEQDVFLTVRPHDKLRVILEVDCDSAFNENQLGKIFYRSSLTSSSSGKRTWRSAKGEGLRALPGRVGYEFEVPNPSLGNTMFKGANIPGYWEPVPVERSLDSDGGMVVRLRYRARSQ